MPRGPGGIYDLYTPGNPVISGTIIDTDWANPTLEDVGVALSDSLSRSGKGGMTAPLRGPDGSEAVPTFSFTSELDSGRYKEGPGQIVETVQGNKVVRFRAGGMDQWNQSLNGGLGDWEPLTPRDAAGTPYDPSFSPLTSDNVQDAIDEVVGLTGGVPTADGVTYDDTAVYFPAATVQIAIDRLGQDLAGVAGDVGDLAGDITIVEGDLALLEGTVLQNVQDIGTNTNNIAVLDSNFSGFYTVEFLPLRDRVTATENVTAINTADIGAVYNFALGLETRITNTENVNDTQNQDIIINTDKADTAQAWADYLYGFFTPGEILQIVKGGTGVQTKTGSGSTVGQDNPTLNNLAHVGGSISSLVTAITQGGRNRTTRIATTEYVQAEIDYIGQWAVRSTSNANGEAVRFYLRDSGASGFTGFIVQWGTVNGISSNNITIQFPLSFGHHDYRFLTSVKFWTRHEYGCEWATDNRAYYNASINVQIPTQTDWIAMGFV